MSQINEIKIEDVVKKVFLDMKLKILTGEFHISEDSIIRFLEFYSIAKYIQENKSNEGVSLRQIHKNKLIVKDKDYTYDKLQDFYSKINKREQYRIKAENELLKEMDQNTSYKAKSYRIKNTSKVKEYNLFQLDMLFDLHNSNSSIKKTCNRLRRNNLKNINYKNLSDLINYFEVRIDKCKTCFKNMELYSIEKTIGKELITTMSYCYNKVKSKYDEKDIAEIFLLVSMIPVIDERHKYLETYAEGISDLEIEILKIELEGLFRFVSYCVEFIKEELEYYKKSNVQIIYDDKKFKKIYINSYKSKYKLKKNFTSDDFSSVMYILEKYSKINSAMHEKQHIEFFKEEKKKQLQDMHEQVKN